MLITRQKNLDVGEFCRSKLSYYSCSTNLGLGALFLAHENSYDSVKPGVEDGFQVSDSSIKVYH